MSDTITIPRIAHCHSASLTFERESYTPAVILETQFGYHEVSPKMKEATTLDINVEFVIPGGISDGDKEKIFSAILERLRSIELE